MNQIPLNFKLEMEDMDNLYTTIQDVRLFKEEVDSQLFEKLHRNSVGRIDAYHHWKKYALAVNRI